LLSAYHGKWRSIAAFIALSAAISLAAVTNAGTGSALARVISNADDARIDLTGTGAIPDPPGVTNE